MSPHLVVVARVERTLKCPPHLISFFTQVFIHGCFAVLRIPLSV